MTDGELSQAFGAARRRVVKWSNYAQIYDRLFSHYRGQPITLVEVGVGAGGSLEGWRGYLRPSARIIGIDLNPDAKHLEADGFEIIIGDQADPEFWARQLSRVGPIDVLIDDGGHTSVQQIVTVSCGLPHVRDGGVIVVEDTHTAYMPKQYPASGRYGFMQFAQHVVDVLHARHPLTAVAVADTAGLGRAIRSVHFFDSLVVFHVDRRRCGPSEGFEAGVEEGPASDQAATLRSRTVDALDAQPAWIRRLLRPARAAIGIALRASTRVSNANRVRRFFR